MNLQDSLSILGLTGTVTFEEAKAAFRRACMKYHPDRNPGGLEMMKAVNTAWDYLQTLDWSREVSGKGNANYGNMLNDAINAIIGISGLNIEICGSWVWVGGDTKPAKEVLKAAGYRWASQKFMWYFRPAEWKSSSRENWDIEKIRYNFGSQKVQGEEREKIG